MYINLIVCPRLASIRDTGGVAVKGTVILPGSALSSPVSNQLWTSNGLFPLFSRRALTFDRFYITRVPEMTMSAIDDELKAIQVTKHKAVVCLVLKHKPSLIELIKQGII